MTKKADEQTSGATGKPKRFVKTPMFVAENAGRYLRQSLIGTIQEAEFASGTGRTLLCYVCGAEAQVDREDIIGFMELLHNVKRGENVDLLLHTGGGDLDAAEKLINLVRATIGHDAQLRAIVPDYAKSAGTLMVLGANEIVMGESSELGTIDPQVDQQDLSGHVLTHSVLVYIDAYKEARSELEKHPDNPANRMMFERFDPTVLREFKAIEARARACAQDLLKPRINAYTAVVNDLLDINRFPSHRQMINWEAAKSLGLEIVYKDPSDELWAKYWELHCHQRLAIGDRQKIFESAVVTHISGPKSDD